MGMKASEFDEKFDSSEDIIEHLDLSSAERKNQSQKRINVDIPVWMLEKLDLEEDKEFIESKIIRDKKIDKLYLNGDNYLENTILIEEQFNKLLFS